MSRSLLTPVGERNLSGNFDNMPTHYSSKANCPAPPLSFWLSPHLLSLLLLSHCLALALCSPSFFSWSLKHILFYKQYPLHLFFPVASHHALPSFLISLSLSLILSLSPLFSYSLCLSFSFYFFSLPTLKLPIKHTLNCYYGSHQGYIFLHIPLSLLSLCLILSLCLSLPLPRSLALLAAL